MACLRRAACTRAADSCAAHPGGHVASRGAGPGAGHCRRHGKAAGEAARSGQAAARWHEGQHAGGAGRHRPDAGRICFAHRAGGRPRDDRAHGSAAGQLGCRDQRRQPAGQAGGRVEVRPRDAWRGPAEEGCRSAGRCPARDRGKERSAGRPGRRDRSGPGPGVLRGSRGADAAGGQQPARMARASGRWFGSWRADAALPHHQGQRPDGRCHALRSDDPRTGNPGRGCAGPAAGAAVGHRGGAGRL